MRLIDSHCHFDAAAFDADRAQAHARALAAGGAAQAVVHAELAHTWSAEHTVAQPPQWVLSLVVSMQAVPHWVVPPLQTTPQLPCEQTSPTAQTLSQAPQLFGS